MQRAGLNCIVQTGLAAMACFLAGCSSKPEGAYYDIPLANAFERLQNADLEGFRDSRQCGMLIHFSSSKIDPTSLAYEVKTSGVSVARFAIRLTSSDKGTLASFEVPKGPNGAEIYDGSQSYSHPALMQPLRPSLRELVDAAMGQRRFDWHRLPDPINTDQLCGTEHSHFVTTGHPYRIGDPKLMNETEAEDARKNGIGMKVEHDQIFESENNPWEN
jgi:hypothetical protein